MSIKNIIIFVFILICMLGCTKIYHKKFIIEGSDRIEYQTISYEYKDFDIDFFIDVVPPGILYAGKKKPVDSLYRVYLRLGKDYTEPKLELELLESFSIKRLDIELSGLDSLIPCTTILRDTIFNSMRAINYEYIIIPENVDTIYVHISFDYLNSKKKLVSESSKIMMFRSEGHYSIPLGFMLD